MANNVLIFDTSVLCCLLEVPGKSTCGPQSDFWDKGRVLKLIKDHKGSIFVLPLASIIETGNHISQANGDRFNVATAFCKYLRNAASGESPWAAFSDQAELWKPEQLLKLSADWPQLASSKISIGVATIKDVK